MKLWRRLRVLLPGYRAAQEREMQEELESLTAMAGKNELGNLTRVVEDARAVWHWSWLETLWQDIRYSIRTLRKSPGFTITAVVVLSIGIGLNLAFFQFINAVFLKPLAVRDPGSLVHVTIPGRRDQLNYPAMQFLRSSNTVFSAVLVEIRTGITTPTAGDEHRIEWDGKTASRHPAFVSANWFDELGVKALRGRLFSESTEGRRDSPAVAVISEGFWEMQLLGDPAILGSTVLTEGGVPVTIIGIVPRGRADLDEGRGLNQPDILVPAEQLPLFLGGGRFGTGEAITGRLFARLKPGISLGAATESLVPLLDELARRQPRYRGNDKLALFSGSTNFRQPRRTDQLLLRGSVFASLPMLILLISCSNLANLVLSRAISRLQELSIRVSLGASRARILRHLLTETVLVAALASCGGLLLTYWAARIFPVIVPAFNRVDLSLDWRTIAAAIAGTIVMTALVGLLPAWTIGKRDLATAMRDGGEQTSHSLSRVRQRQFLLALQVAGSCLLLIVTSFILRTVQHTLAPPGYDTENVLILDNNVMERLELTRPDAANAYWKNLREYMAQQPGIESVALSENWPSHYVDLGRVAALPGLSFDGARVEPDFFRLLRIPFLNGKPFPASDSQGQSVVLSNGLALQAFGTVDVVGKVFPELGRVTGVVHDVRLAGGERPDRPEAYIPLKVPDRLLVRARTTADATRLLYTLPKSLRQFDSRVPDVDRLERKLNDGVAEMRLMGAAFSGLATLALSVACMGIFGVVSYGVALRRKEIGIRLALGALDRSILWLIARQILWSVGLATVAGAIGGLAVGMVMASERMLLPPEVPVVAAALLVLLAMIGLACVLPTLRMLRSADSRILSS